MQKAEFKDQTPQGIEYWLSSIESNWKHIPEFEVDHDFRHLAIICDGNRRSAQEKGLETWQGHRLGVEAVKGVMKACRQWGVKNLTFWAFSTENWRRDSKQVEFFMALAAEHLGSEDSIRTLIESKARFSHFGRKDRLPENVKSSIERLEKATVHLDELFVNLAMDYGGIDETARAFVSLMKEVQSGRLNEEEILRDPSLILEYLDTRGQSAPDLVIRTGVVDGEVPHTSGFMPLQTAYSGWSFIPDLFPDLTPQVLLSEIQRFINYERRYGR